MADRNVFKLVRSSLDRIPIIDTHEQMGRRDYAPFSGADDMLRRLMPREAAGFWRGQGARKGNARPDAVKTCVPFSSFKALLDTAKNTFVYRYVLETFADLFDCHSTEINEANWRFLSDQIVERTTGATWPRDVFRQKANIEAVLTSYTSLTPQAPRWAQGLFIPLLRVDHFLLLPISAKGRRSLDRRYNVSLRNLNDLLALVEKTIRTAAENGFAGLRTRLASFRTLHIENVPPSAVQGLLEKGERGLTAGEVKRLQDFVFHAIVQCAILHKLPIQIDAGLGGAGTSSLDRANPLHLTDMIFNYADARFAILHGGFPFTGETAVLAKTFPNIYLDGSGLRYVSFAMAKAVLHEWLEVVPCGKMMIWGGNSRYPEASYLSLLMTKDIMAEVLAEKVQSGYLGEGLAVDIAWRLFRENAKSFYGLDRRRAIGA